MGRIAKEMREMNSEEPCYAEPSEDDTNSWSGFVLGPDDTVYEGGKFLLSITLEDDYPFSPPNVRFETPVYHPNIGENGAICLDILKDEWSPALTIHKVLVSLRSLLADHNPDDPLVAHIAQQYMDYREEFDKDARKYTRKYAMKEESMDDNA